jgi:hypothetical protein
MNSAQHTTQDALSALLASLGFEAMAREVKSEQDNERLSRYSRIVVKNSPVQIRRQLTVRFHFLGLRVL